MLYSEAMFMLLCLMCMAVAGLLYLCCQQLSTLEKKKFRHTDFIIREKELEEVMSTKPRENSVKPEIPNGPAMVPAEEDLPRKPSTTGESFDEGKDSLYEEENQNPDDAGEKDDLLNNMVYGPPPPAEKE